MSDLLGVNAIVLVFAAVNGLEVERMGQDELDAGVGTGIGQPIPAEHALGTNGQVVAIGRDEFEEIGEVIVFDVVWTSFLPSRSRTQTYIWRACRSIPQLNWVVEV